MNQGWIGFDLDDTLASYDGWHGEEHIGEPIIPMILKLQQFINAGYKCKIFTARAGNGIAQINHIHNWLNHYGLPSLEVTNIKDFNCICFYDDRCIAVESGTGIILGGKEIVL